MMLKAWDTSGIQHIFLDSNLGLGGGGRTNTDKGTLGSYFGGRENSLQGKDRKKRGNSWGRGVKRCIGMAHKTERRFCREHHVYWDYRVRVPLSQKEREKRSTPRESQEAEKKGHGRGEKSQKLCT